MAVNSTSIEAAKSTEPSWEKHMDDVIIPELHFDAFLQKRLLSVIRALLHAPEDDVAAPSRATAEYEAYFHDNFLDKESDTFDAWYVQHTNENCAPISADICSFCIEMAAYFPPDSVKHNQLVEFVQGFTKTTPETFDAENPQIPFSNNWAAGALRERSDGARLYPADWSDDKDLYETECNEKVNEKAFEAKMFTIGVLDALDIFWTLSEVEDGLDKEAYPATADSENGNCVEELFWQANVAIAANHILIAGYPIAALLKLKGPMKKNAQFMTEDRLNPAKWKGWAEKLAVIADTCPEDARWGLKTKARLAHDKMVALLPEAFT